MLEKLQQNNPMVVSNWFADTVRKRQLQANNATLKEYSKFGGDWDEIPEDDNLSCRHTMLLQKRQKRNMIDGTQTLVLHLTSHIERIGWTPIWICPIHYQPLLETTNEKQHSVKEVFNWDCQSRDYSPKCLLCTRTS